MAAVSTKTLVLAQSTFLTSPNPRWREILSVKPDELRVDREGIGRSPFGKTYRTQWGSIVVTVYRITKNLTQRETQNLLDQASTIRFACLHPLTGEWC
jgi:hypothetical protein